MPKPTSEFMRAAEREARAMTNGREWTPDNRTLARDSVKRAFADTFRDKSINVKLDANGDIDDVDVPDEAFERMEQLADDLARHAVEINYQAKSEFEAIRRAVRERPLYLSPTDRVDIPDFRAYNRSSENRIRFTNDRRATSVDSVYFDLSKRFPQHFDGTATHPADQVRQINAVLSDLKNRSAMPLLKTQGRDAVEETKGIITMQLLDGYNRAYIKSMKGKKK